MANPLGSTPGIIVGVGVGAAASVALEPAIELPKQNAWARNRNRILDPELIGRLVAEGGVTLDAAHASGARHGLTDDKVDALVYLAQTVPGVALALRLWRRDAIADDLWTHALRKAGLDARYWPALNELKVDRLDPAIIATAIQRGIMRAPFALPVGPPTGVGKVPAFPVSPLNAKDEAAAAGIDLDRLFVETAIVGLPLGLIEAAHAYYRGIIELDDFKRAVAEGNTRNEWGDAALAVAREILTANQYAELQLRGFLTPDERRAFTAQHGMTTADSDRLYDVLGRSIPVHQVTTGVARGGSFGGTGAGIPAEYLQTLQRGNLRPEYYDLAYTNRYSYPTAFFFRALLQSGDLTAAEGEQAFLELGWSPKWAHKVATALVPASGPVADVHIAKAQVQLWTAVHRSYLNHHTSNAQATPVLERAGVAAAAVPTVLELWQLERELVRRELTAKQLVKAYRDGVQNPATGAAWTAAEAIAALVDLGYDQADAEVLVAEG